MSTTPAPTTADERTTTAITRALRGNWGLRRIQSYVEGVITGGSATEPITDTNLALPATAPPARDKGAGSGSAHEPPGATCWPTGSSLPEVCPSTSERFTRYLSRLKAASRAQLEAARVTIDDVRQLV